MPSSDRKATPQVLNAPGDIRQSVDSEGPTVTRYPLVYTPGSATQLNFARLPEPAQLLGMDLAYREQLLTDDQVRTLARSRGAFLLLSCVVGAIVVTILGRMELLGILPLIVASSGVTSFLAVILALRGLMVGMQVVARIILIPMLVAVVAFGLAQLTVHRLWSAVFFGLLTAAAFFFLGLRPFQFYQDWLLTHPRLRPETRLAFQQRVFKIDELFLYGILVAIVVGPAISTTLTLIGIAIACYMKIEGLREFRTRHVLYDVVGHYITYGRQSSGAPGVWNVSAALSDRIWTTVVLVAPLFLALTTGLHAFFPADLVGYSSFVPLPKETTFRGFRNDKPLGWVQVIFEKAAMERMSAAESAYQTTGDEQVAVAIAAHRTVPVETLATFLVPIALSAAFVLPTLVLLAVFRPAIRSAEELRRLIEGQTDQDGAVSGGLDDDGRSEWQWYVDRIRTSPHRAADPLDPLGDPIREAEHLFLGIEPNFKFPVLLDRRILSEHTYIVGETGSGKTSLGIMPLVLQLLHGSAPRDKAPPNAEVDPAKKPKRDTPPVVIIDLKGDPALFHTLEQTCRDLKIPFRFFTPQPGRASHYFNAFRELRSDARSTIQLAQLILDSLALSHGEGYGRSYYSRQSRRALLKVLTDHPKVESFAELHKLLEGLRKDKKDAFELISTIHALTFYPQLVTDPKAAYPNETVIHMPRVLEDREVVYFWLPAALESASVREIGKLALYALLTAAIDRQYAGKETRQAYLVIDEFQRLAGENFKIILEQARSFGVAAILANQTQSDLATPDADLRPTVRTNTRLKLYFSVTDPGEVRTLIESSGEELSTLKSWGGSSDTVTMQTETLKPRLTRNDVIGASDHPLHFIAHVSRGSGYTQFGGMPIPVRTTWPFTRDVYKTRSGAKWPALSPDLAKGAQNIADIEKARVQEATDAELAASKQRLEKLLEEKMGKGKPA